MRDSFRSSRHARARHLRFQQVPNELEPLRFAAGKVLSGCPSRRYPSPTSSRTSSGSDELFALADLREKRHRFGHRQLEHIVNRFAVQLNLQHVRLETSAFAFRATDIEIAQELHLDFLETGAAATFATAAAGVEGERARGQSLRHRFRQAPRRARAPDRKARGTGSASNAGCAPAAIDRP